MLIIFFLINTIMASNSFAPPPLKHFQLPQHPSPMTPSGVFPYFMGNVFWPMGPQSLYNYSIFNFPESTEFEVLRSYDSDYYETSIHSTPDFSFLDDLEDQRFYVKKSSVKDLTPNSSGNYTLTKKTIFYQRQEIQNKEKDEACLDCKEKQNKELQNAKEINDLRLEIIKKQILKTNQVPKKALLNAFDHYKKNKNKIKNHNYLTVIDYSLPSTVPRLFLIDLKTGKVDKHMVSHGINSSGKGPLQNYAVNYSNTNNSKASSHGAFLTGESYLGRFGYSLRVDGQQSGINSNARKRAIVIHPYDKVNNSLAGDTWGCFGLSKAVSKQIINKTKNGSLWYVEPYST